MIGFISRSIPRRILAALVVIYITTYIATAAVVYSSVYASILESRESALHELAQRKYERLENVFQSLGTNITAWSQLEVMNDLVSGDLDKRVTSTLEGLKKFYGLQGDIYAYDAKGELVADTRLGDQARDLPAQWRNDTAGLAFVDKHIDPISGVEIVALEIPVFGRFDRNFKIGQIVLTYPWSLVEKLIFARDSATILARTDNVIRPLAADTAQLTGSEDFIRQAPWADARHKGFIIGQSTSDNGILSRWQLFTLQKSNVVAHSLQRVGGELVLLGLTLAIPMIALGRWLSRRLTAPIIELTRVVGEIADTDKLAARVPVASSDELGTLARAFNRMTESLEQANREREQFVKELEVLNRSLETKVAARTQELEIAIAAQQRLIGDISHEIKSPLARLGMALGLLRRASDDSSTPRHFDRMEREISNISTLASELLTLVRLNSMAAVPISSVDICALVRNIADDAIYEAPHRKSDVVLSMSSDSIWLDASEDLLGRAIENVVRNALFYTSPNTPIHIVVQQKDDVKRALIEVRDEGPGVPEAALAHLFEPFYRVDEARARKTGGSGIGLSICQRVITLHRGTVQARSNQPHGLIVDIEIPLHLRDA